VALLTTRGWKAALTDKKWGRRGGGQEPQREILIGECRRILGPRVALAHGCGRVLRHAHAGCYGKVGRQRAVAATATHGADTALRGLFA
jgi:hypothetical protein